MKHLKKIVLLLAVVSLIFNVSCSKDDGDDVTTDLSELEFVFDQSNPPVDQTIISNLSSSGDANATQIASQLSIANLMTLYLGFFEETQGSIKTNTPIGTCGGDAVVYTYTASDGVESFTVAYQICETSDKYTFQVLTSQNGVDFNLLIYAEESKADLREGLMNIYAGDPTDVEAGSEIIIAYTWKENSDGSFDYTASNDDAGFLLSIKINADNSGTLSYRLDGVLFYEATWNSTGTAGTYTNYDSEGNEVASGNWPG
ncbi:hypothetical protein [Ekhidna sp.]